MASTWPAKNNYATGDVLTAANMNGIGDDLNDLYTSSGFAAGKNKVLNADIAINQRNFTSGTANSFTADRWNSLASGGTVTRSVQAFTAGAAPVTGYEAAQFLRVVTASQSATTDYAGYLQPIEDVRTFANQTVTLSFWAKAASGTPKVGITLEQNFGSGGSATVYTSNANTTITTSWARYSITLNVPSISGKTIGTSSFLGLWLFSSVGTSVSGTGYPAIGIQNTTIDFWGIQLEAGSIATPFQTATGTKQGELAACQRYYWRNTQNSTRYGTGYATSTTVSNIWITFPVTMRTAPSALEQSGTAGDYLVAYGAGAAACSAVPSFLSASAVGSLVSFTIAAGLTAGDGLNAGANGTGSYLGWSAEF